MVSSVYHYTHMAGHTGVLKTYLDYYSALLLVGRLQRGKRGSVTMWYLHKKKIHSTQITKTDKSNRSISSTTWEYRNGSILQPIPYQRKTIIR